MTCLSNVWSRSKIFEIKAFWTCSLVPALRPRLACSNVRHSPSKGPVNEMSWTCRRDEWAKRPGQFEAARSLGRYLQTQTQGHHTIDRILGERRSDRKLQTTFLETTRKGHRQSDQYRGCFKSNSRETSETV